MSTPRELALHPSVRRRTTPTPRGDFATLECAPSTSSLPRGAALLIPGFTGSKEDFAPLLPLLADAGWLAATYDQRGQFETPGGADDDYSLTGFAADALEVAIALFGPDEQPHLVGHSFGGLVASTAALAAPDRWASVTLLCSGAGALPPSAGGDEARAAAQSVLRDGLEASYEAKAVRDAQRGKPPPPADVEAFLRRRFLANSAQSLSAICTLLAEAPDRRSELADLDLPIKVIRGAADDAWPHGVQDAVAAALGTRVQVIEGAAHSPAVEQPEATRDALVRGWLS